MIFDGIRAIAALMVLVGHANGIFGPAPAMWPQQFGVAIFFLLSGYLISQTLHRRIDRPGSTFMDYAIDRWSRIYSGFLPALLVVALIDHYTITHYSNVHPETVARSTVELFFANMAMLQLPTWFLPFGSAAPFWTVAVEFWIYMFIGLIAFSIRDGLSPARFALIAMFGLVPMSCVTDNAMVFVPWLMGACAERIIAARWLDRVPVPVMAVIGAATIAWLIVTIAGGQRVYSFQTYLGSAVVLAMVGAIAERYGDASTRWQTAAAWSASWSYSLYLLHHTILMSLEHTFGGGERNKWGAVAVSIAVAIVFASLTEAHHKRLALYIKSRIEKYPAVFRRNHAGAIGPRRL